METTKFYPEISRMTITEFNAEVARLGLELNAITMAETQARLAELNEAFMGAPVNGSTPTPKVASARKPPAGTVNGVHRVSRRAAVRKGAPGVPTTLGVNGTLVNDPSNPAAPYGTKKDGSPAARRGRKPGAASKVATRKPAATAHTAKPAARRRSTSRV